MPSEIKTFDSIPIVPQALDDLKKVVIRGSGSYNANTITAPYDDCNTVPYNTIICYVNAYPSNGPDTAFPNNMLSLMTYTYMPYTQGDSLLGGAVQLAAGTENVWMRCKYTASKWGAWLNLTSFIATGLLFSSSNAPTAPYNDLNTFPRNVVATYNSNSPMPANAPKGVSGLFTVVSFNYIGKNRGGSVQLVYDAENTWFRIATTETNAGIKRWVKINRTAYENTPALSLFDKIGVIGDSWSAGSVYTSSSAHQDVDKLRWAYIASKKYGFEPSIFASPGATTATWLTRANGLQAMQAADAQELYICALGINDHATGLAIGNEADMDDDTKTNFYGSYGKIIRAILTKSPGAKIAVALIPMYNGAVDVSSYNNAIRNVASHFGVGLLDTENDAFFNSSFFAKARAYNHLNATGYCGMAEAMNCMLGTSFFNDNAYWKYSMM